MYFEWVFEEYTGGKMCMMVGRDGGQMIEKKNTNDYGNLCDRIFHPPKIEQRPKIQVLCCTEIQIKTHTHTSSQSENEKHTHTNKANKQNKHFYMVHTLPNSTDNEMYLHVFIQTIQ